MALLHCNFFSEILGLSCAMDVILPQRPLAEMQSTPQPKIPTLYLLHGLSDDHTTWQRRTSIERYVENRNLAVVMPAVHRSFYTDMAHGGRYWKFISEEVPAVARSLFPLSGRREENFVAGLSMGGYGAFKLALAHPERFAAAASLSGAVEIARPPEDRPVAEDDPWIVELKNIFGDLTQLPGSANDLRHLAQQAAKAPDRPRLYQCCGTEDFLYQSNLTFRDFVQPLGFDYTYEESPGEHIWAFWDAYIQKVLTWLEAAG
ncbi:MAG: alpha/beta hydrolase [Chloroflexota bacterium]